MFKDRTGGNPPIRGPHGEAEIILKPGAVAVKQRPYTMIGERKAAVEEKIDGLIKDVKLEDSVSGGAR